MTVTVAPLTTVVMNSVKEDRVGHGFRNQQCSGAGRRRTRDCSAWDRDGEGVWFSTSIEAWLSLSLPSYILQELQANEIKLAGLQAARRA